MESHDSKRRNLTVTLLNKREEEDELHFKQIKYDKIYEMKRYSMERYHNTIQSCKNIFFKGLFVSFKSCKLV
jgi:hypothetical protein